ISNDENQAVKIRRYLDFIVKNAKGDNFSMETLAYTTIADTRNFSLKWMYSIDGKIFLPITEFLLPVEKSVAGIPFSPPLYLPVYKGLNNIDGDKGVILRCAIVRGNGAGIFMKFDDVISIGGRVL